MSDGIVHGVFLPALLLVRGNVPTGLRFSAERSAPPLGGDFPPRGAVLETTNQILKQILRGGKRADCGTPHLSRSGVGMGDHAFIYQAAS